MTIPKYRAFHKQYKIMLPVLQIDLDPEHGGVFVESNDGSYCGCRFHMELWPWSDIELMQWTGAKEAHEIYDGDIVEIMNCWSEKNIARVLWGDVHPMNRWHSGPTWLLHFENGLEGPLYPYCDYRNGYTVKIIGTIWQHPQLLQSKEPQP